MPAQRRNSRLKWKRDRPAARASSASVGCSRQCASMCAMARAMRWKSRVSR
jgi:hypothetical protein